MNVRLLKKKSTIGLVVPRTRDMEKGGRLLSKVVVMKQAF